MKLPEFNYLENKSRKLWTFLTIFLVYSSHSAKFGKNSLNFTSQCKLFVNLHAQYFLFAH